MFKPQTYRKALPENTDNSARNYANGMANMVAAFIERAYEETKNTHPYITSDDFKHMLECIDEAITEGFWESIREDDIANQERAASEPSDFAEHNTLNHAQLGTTARM